MGYTPNIPQFYGQLIGKLCYWLEGQYLSLWNTGGFEFDDWMDKKPSSNQYWFLSLMIEHHNLFRARIIDNENSSGWIVGIRWDRDGLLLTLGRINRPPNYSMKHPCFLTLVHHASINTYSTSFPMVWQVSQWGFAMENGAFSSMIYLSKIVFSSSQTVSLRAGIDQYSIWHPIHIPFDIPIIYPTHIPSRCHSFSIHIPSISHSFPPGVRRRSQRRWRSRGGRSSGMDVELRASC
jgi:hypothetical protein